MHSLLSLSHTQTHTCTHTLIHTHVCTHTHANVHVHTHTLFWRCKTTVWLKWSRMGVVILADGVGRNLHLGAMTARAMDRLRRQCLELMCGCSGYQTLEQLSWQCVGLATLRDTASRVCPSSKPSVPMYFSLGVDRYIGLVVKASASREEDPGFKSRLRRDFFRGRVIWLT